MLRRAALSISALVLAVTLLLNFQGPGTVASAVLQVTSGSSGSGSTASSGSIGVTSRSSSSSSSSAGSSSSSTATAAPASGAGTYTGGLVATPYGDVQVQITVANGSITDVRALALPIGGHSGRISSIVAPMLRSEALTAQSGSINVISGATFTSLAYARSLQSAIDAAGI